MPPPIATSDFPVAAAVAARTPAPARAAWAPVLPPLPALALDAAAAWGLEVAAEPDAPDPLAVPSFAALLAHLRAEQVLRALAARTNRTLAGSRALVAGGGALAEAHTAALGGLGARVTLATDDPRAALRARLRGLRVTGSPADAADHVVVTGDGPAPLDPATLHGTVIDASYTGTGLRPAPAAPAERAGVRAVGSAWVVDAPPLWDAGSALGRLAIDAFLALSLLAAVSPASGDDPDRRLDLDRRFAAALPA